MTEYRCGTFYRNILNEYNISILRTVFLDVDIENPRYILSDNDAAYLKLCDLPISLILHKKDREHCNSTKMVCEWEKDPLTYFYNVNRECHKR